VTSAVASEREVVRRLGELRVLPVTTVEDAAQAEGAGRALAAGGLPCIEVAFRTEAAAEALRRVAASGELLVGAGTVLTAEQAEAAAAAGASFAVAPALNEEVVAACARLGLPFFPGIATPSELDRARALGLRAVKVFPAAQLGGPGFLKALAAVYPDVRFMPTGGIGADSLASYLALPSVLCVGGSWLVAPELLRAGRFDEVERLARAAVAAAAP
jgi:2-dehydro-3-deoxyphosphogluconate aldolase/(4S)-4-hydroxy-2-oxoglutarate aldolase